MRRLATIRARRYLPLLEGIYATLFWRPMPSPNSPTLIVVRNSLPLHERIHLLLGASWVVPWMSETICPPLLAGASWGAIDFPTLSTSYYAHWYSLLVTLLWCSFYGVSSPPVAPLGYVTSSSERGANSTSPPQIGSNSSQGGEVDKLLQRF